LGKPICNLFSNVILGGIVTRRGGVVNLPAGGAEFCSIAVKTDCGELDIEAEGALAHDLAKCDKGDYLTVVGWLVEHRWKTQGQENRQKLSVAVHRVVSHVCHAILEGPWIIAAQEQETNHA